MQARMPAFALLALLALALFAAGCHHGVRACVDATVRPQMATIGNSGPLVPTSLQPCCCSDCAVAIIDVDGLLLNQDLTGLGSTGDNPVAVFRERLDAVARDSCVQAVVLRINTPGGGVTASDIMCRDLVEFKQRTGKPVIACLMDVAAGGGYFLATGADSIVAHPTAVTGGIGVILNVYNLQDAMAQFNVVAAPVKAGHNIDLGSPVKALETEQRAILQAMASEFHNRFRQRVILSRPHVDQNDETNFDGRIFTATQAEKRGLVDQIGYLDDAVEMARGLIGCPTASIVMFHRGNDTPRSQYYVTPNVPLQGTVVPVSMPGLDRTKLPAFLYLWQMEPTTEKLSGR